jgi:hypothetical protein
MLVVQLVMNAEASMRTRRLLIAGTAMILIVGMLGASEKHEKWMDEPFRKWDQKQVAELLNNSAWAQTKAFRGQAAAGGSRGGGRSGGRGQNAGTMGPGAGATPGTDVAEFNFTARFFSAEPIREAYVRMLQIMNHYDALPADRQQAFDQKVDGLLHADAGQQVEVTLSYAINDPVAMRDLNEWFNTQTADTLKQNAYLYTPSAGQLELLKYFSPQQGGGLGAQFIFPRTLHGEPILQPGPGRLRFQLSHLPRLNQTMYIDFKPKEMTYKGQFSY